MLTRPDTIGVVLDRPIGAELAHRKGGSNRFLVPLAMISSPELIHECLRLDIRSKVVRDLLISMWIGKTSRQLTK
jgi:hypothetical protein